MGLQGDLTSFDAADVLRLLSWTKKSGTLDLSGDRGHGLLRVLNGKVIGGAVDDARTSTDAEVVYELLRFRIGTFLFEEGEPRSNRKPASVDDVLAGAATLLSEWKAIESVVPDFDRSIRLVPDVPADGVHLSATEWKAIVELGGGATVRQLGDRLDASDLAVGGTVKGLVERGMVTLDEPVAAVEDDEEDDEDADELDVDSLGAGEQAEPGDPSIGGLRGFAAVSADDDGGEDEEPAEPTGGADDGDDEPERVVQTTVPEAGTPGGIRLDYEPGFDEAPAPRRATTAASAGTGRMPPVAAQPTVAVAHDEVVSGRATDRRPYVDLGAAGLPVKPARPAPLAPPTAPPTPPPPSSSAPSPPTEPGTSWQPAWAQTAGLDIPTVGGTVEADDDLTGRKKGRRRFRRH